jgi:hypothetical protein
MAEVDNLVNEAAGESEDDSEGEQGMKNAYSVEDLLGELDSDDGQRDPGLNYEASTVQSENVQSSMKTEPNSTEAGDALLAGGDHMSGRVYGTDDGHSSLQGLCPPDQLQCGDHSPAESQETASDQLTCNATAVENQPISEESACANAALETAVLIGDTYSLTYDEVLTENVYQDPFEDNEGMKF